MDAADESLRTAPEDWREQTAGAEGRHQPVPHRGHHRAFPQDRQARQSSSAADLPLDQRLANYIIEGTKDGLIADLDRKRAEGAAPLDIINGPLMAGMTEVGRLFNNNELIVAEVLQSAEAMKAAVSHLEQFMEKAETAARGKVILATVKGDVHDIGKNLVEIILSNNGYQVINLGIKVPPEALIQRLPGAPAGRHRALRPAGEEHAADGDHGRRSEGRGHRRAAAGGRRGALREVHAHEDRAGLRRSGLLRQGRHDRAEPDEPPDGPGGARRRCWPRIRPAAVAAAPAAAAEPAPPAPSARGAARKVRTDMPIPAAPYLERKVRDVPHLAEVWSYINPFMLYGRHLGYKGNFEKALAEHEAEGAGAVPQRGRGEAGSRALHEGEGGVAVLRGRARRQRHPPVRAGAARRRIHTFRFGRQRREDGLCLSDYILDAEEGRRDHLALFVVTAGACVRERSEEWKQAGEFFKAHAIQALAIETAEGTRGVAAPPHPRGLGLPRSADHHHARPLHVAVPRQALQLRLPGVSQSGRPAGLC